MRKDENKSSADQLEDDDGCHNRKEGTDGPGIGEQEGSGHWLDRRDRLLPSSRSWIWCLYLSCLHQGHLLLFDDNMPGMDGLDLCRRLNKSRPIVVALLLPAFSSIATTSSAAET
jgi:CheY-like chemotaxis protein